ncbi:MAG: hypothetical protein A2144_06725 [Chloroflexi bacterium RBG_16_50_9]|nr:MAG: hypothetical protein A2144_06725 [Chloroflexi bacterium RBG_16_50_9]
MFRTFVFMSIKALPTNFVIFPYQKPIGKNQATRLGVQICHYRRPRFSGCKRPIDRILNIRVNLYKLMIKNQHLYLYGGTKTLV